MQGFDNVNDLFRYMLKKDPPFVGGFDPYNKQFLLLDEVTELVVFHEMCHVKQFKELGPQKYLELPKLKREEYVWDQILKNKRRWTQAELDDAYGYILRKRDEFK